MSTPTSPLSGRRVLILGAGGIATALAAAVRDRGATAITAARAAGAADVRLDLADEATIPAALDAAGPLHHVISTASAAANGLVTELGEDAIRAAVTAKLTGAVLLAKHAAPRLPDDGSLTFFSGVVAWRPGPGQAVMAMTNGGLAHLGAALAVELGPTRVNVISPGIVDSGLWDGRPDRDAFFEQTAERTPARRFGRPEDVAQVVLTALENPFVTGSVLHVDGGGRWA